MANATGHIPMSTTRWGDDKIRRNTNTTVATFYPGAMIGIDSASTAIKFDDSAAGLKFDGLNASADPTYVLSGDAAGAHVIVVERPWRFQMAIAAAAAGDEGKALYAVDDNHVGYTSTNLNLVGWVDQVINATTVSVRPIWAGAVGTYGGPALGSTSAVKNTNIATVGAGTLTGAAIVGGVITRSGSTAAFSDATDTAANIIAALPIADIGESWVLTLINTTGFAETITAGAGVTLSGLAGPIPGNATATFLVTYTAAGAVTMQITTIVYNAAGGFDPANVTTQFGAGTGTFQEEGNINRQVPGVAAAVAPGGTGTDNVVGVFSLPANSFDQALRGLTITAAGLFAANVNTKRIKLWWNATTAVLGAAITGGSLLADTGAVATNGGGWEVSGNVFKRGAANSNTQTTTSNGAVAGGVHVGVVPPLDTTAVENAPILIAVTINNTTAVGDASLVWLEVNAMN